MKCLLLLFMCWCSSLLPVTSCIRVDEHSCLSTYWSTITCVLNISGKPAGQSSTNYSLNFIDRGFRKRNYSCSLVMINHSYTCDCQVRKGCFTVEDSYGIELCHESVCHPLEEKFYPSENIQLSPPVGVEVQPTPENFNVTWKSGYEDHHRDIDKDIIYQLVLQATSLGTSIGGDTHLNVSSGKVLTISRSRLKPGAAYCIKVRSFPKHGDFRGSWSNWCPSVCWKNGPEEEQENILVILTKSLVSVCVVVGVLLFVFYSPAARMKIKNLSHTPSPATFFQPLFQQHEGNLKEWLSPQGKYMLTYTAEEILTSDAIIVVPKPIAKDSEENQGLQKPPVTQLTFTQCQTSYVGLPGIHEASPPLTTVSPGNTSYTRLPCSARGVEIGEIEVVSPSPEDIFNISHSDSGCEDLTQSPECSSPNSPVDNTPPPCYCNDYCILNKTADGFAPVLVSKEAV